jgi:virginiamycin B lyase
MLPEGLCRLCVCEFSMREGTMRTRFFLLIAALSLFFAAVQAAPKPAPGAADPLGPAALAGQISSQEEGPMEGVVVSAKKDGSTITVSVISDNKGHYSFPASRLDAGHYTLKIRAVGYSLEAPATVDLEAQKPAATDLKLVKAKNLVPQLTNAELITSMPGTDDQKNFLLNCVSCHTLHRIVQSTHDADEFTQVITRMMGYAQVSQPIKPQRRVEQNRGGDPEQYRKNAEFLSTVNLSSVSQWEYHFKTFPRPTGKATHVVITEYELPRPTIEPHDVIVDEHGLVWYTDFGEMFIGKLDPKTGALKEYPVPELKPGYPQGLLDIEEDKAGDMWMGMMYQGALAKFDRKTETIKTYSLPKQWNDEAAQPNMLGMRYDVDGKIWTDSAGHYDIFRLDVKTGTYEQFEPMKQLPDSRRGTIYGIDSDSHNNLYFTDFATDYIGRIDSKTGKVAWFQTPTANSRPRRIRTDAQDRAFFGEYQGNKIGMLDPETAKITEWALPTPWSGPYYVTWDKAGMIYTGGMTTDRLEKVNPKTGEVIEYLMPRDTNMRRVFADDSTTPATIWTGSNHGAAIVRIEPLD